MSYGFRIKKSWERVSAEMVERARGLPVANVSDCMSRMDAGGDELRPYHQSGQMAGPALTVRCRPGDNLMLHKAIDMAEPGDVIVCDAGGDNTNALFGELMMSHAMKKRVAGFVLNGAIRDRQTLYELNVPVYATGVTHRGPYKDGPGEIGYAIALSGSVIEPGDLMLGDMDGVLAVPKAHAAAILDAAHAKKAAEAKQMASIEDGSIDRGWVDKTLLERGCVFED